MNLVDTATLAVYLGVTPRHVARLVAEGKLKPAGQWGRGSRRGRPGWCFDFDAVRAALDEDRGTSDIGS